MINWVLNKNQEITNAQNTDIYLYKSLKKQYIHNIYQIYAKSISPKQNKLTITFYYKYSKKCSTTITYASH